MRREQMLRAKLSPILLEQTELHQSIQNKLVEIELEAERVAEIMYSTPEILEDLDRQFAEKTKLTSTDIVFLLIATGLQCLRQYFLSSDRFRSTAKDGDNGVKKVVPKKWHDILLAPVPYDTVQLTPEFKATGVNTGLSGTTHRYRTLGHDPLFGWIFGPVNIITDSLTKTDVITTYSVSNAKISGFYQTGTFGAYNDCYDFICHDKYLLPVSIMRQAIHFGSDYFTKQGLPIPLISTFNDDFARVLVTRFNVDMYSVMRSATMSMFINTIVMYVHALFYDESMGISPDLYSTRTRKILSYSNAIASGSNIVYVTLSSYLGNRKGLKKLDIGGLLVTIYRLISDYRYVAQLKREFLKNEFYNIVMNKNNR